MNYVDEWHDAIYRTDDRRGGRGGRPRFDWVGADRDARESVGEDADGARPLDRSALEEALEGIRRYWRPPMIPQHGMSSRQLADHQKELSKYARGRILGVGAEQYDDSTEQRFESMTLDELWTGAREEIADLINYLAMLDIRLGRMVMEVSRNV